MELNSASSQPTARSDAGDYLNLGFALRSRDFVLAVCSAPAMPVSVCRPAHAAVITAV
jgi:hypothetical protein